MSAKRLYVIGNSHMDPVWLWRLREGRSTWLNTCRATVDMMKKHPFLKFSRSSTAAYKWIEESDPDLFEEIRALVAAKRWEPVGGWVEQSDTIVADAESLLRQAALGNAYFREKFGAPTRIAYCVDSFGQNAGLPKIMGASGFDRYVWMRPSEWEMGGKPHLFKWRGDDGSPGVTCVRIRWGYGTWLRSTRDNLFHGLDELIKHGDEHQTYFFGVGDHGGGIYERHLEWLEEYRKNHDLVYSTLEEYFNIVDKLDLPVLGGEHTHHAPGCYSSVSGVKKWMARAERNLHKAEKMLVENPFFTPVQRLAGTLRTREAWEPLLFNYFHDVYPGTSTFASYDEEIRDDLGMANKTAVDIVELGLSKYASRIRTDFLKEGGVLVWNPLPHPVRARFGFDAFADPNAVGAGFDTLTDADGNTLPLQLFNAACTCNPGGTWKRLTAVLDLPASGLRAFAYGRLEGETPSNLKPLGFDRQRAWLEKLSFEVLRDLGDTWGHGLKRLGATLGSAAFAGTEEMENGPVGSRLRARYTWKNSTLVLDLFAWDGIPEIEARFSGDWHEKQESLKLVFTESAASGDILSGQSACVISRKPDDCEQPFNNWVALQHNGRLAGFIVESLHGYDSEGPQKLRLTVNRPMYYAHHDPYPASGDEGMADMGQIAQRLWLFDVCGNSSDLPRLARSRVFGVEHYEITKASDGARFTRDVWSVEPACVEILSQRPGPDGMAFDLLNNSAREVVCRLLRNNTEAGSCKLGPNGLVLMTLK